MPVTVYPVDQPSRRWRQSSTAATATELLRKSCAVEHDRCERVIQSSFGNIGQQTVFPSQNGFVTAAIAAYCHHHHLTIRPEDVWFAVLTQLAYHIDANAKNLRHLFVSHKGQQNIKVVEAGNIHTVDFGALAVQMTGMMDKHFVDPDLRRWIMPDFTTTTSTDRVTAAVLMMGAMQKYFSYEVCLTCGIPSVTLLGKKQDWVSIRERLDKLAQLGEEPEQFGTLLKPVLDYFIRTFDNPKSPAVRDFWGKIADEKHGSGMYCLSGWITAFCFWDDKGQVLYKGPLSGAADPSSWHADVPGCEIDGTLYHRVYEIPGAFVSVPVQVNDNGRLYKTRMVAGSVGIVVTSSGNKLDETYRHSRDWSHRGNIPGVSFNEMKRLASGDPGPDSLQPLSGWWIYEIKGTGAGKVLSPHEGDEVVLSRESDAVQEAVLARADSVRESRS